MQAVKDMVADLSQLIDAHNRGEDTDERFREFMDKHGQFFPDDPSRSRSSSTPSPAGPPRRNA